METVQVKNKPLIQSIQVRSPIQTTLYELMETVIDVADRKEEQTGKRGNNKYTGKGNTAHSY